MKKILIYTVVFIVVLVVVFIFFTKNKKTEIVQNPPVLESIKLDDKIIVEKYIRDNVKIIVPEKPVLGGSWYITFVNIYPSTKTGTMTYEDGHIQGNKNFSYIRNNNEVEINLINIPPKELVACTMEAKQCSDGSYVGRTGTNCQFVCPQ